MTSFLSRHILMMGFGGEVKPLMGLFVTPLRHQLRKKYCNSTGQNVSNTRLNSTAPSSSSTPTPSTGGGTEGTPAKASLFARFKQMAKDYYYVLIPVHIVTSLGWFGSFYHTSKSGVDIGKYMKKMGLPDHLVEKVTESGMGHVAVAYALYKIATPARYTVTLGGTTWTINRLVRLGWIKPAKEIISKGKERFKDIKKISQRKP